MAEQTTGSSTACIQVQPLCISSIMCIYMYLYKYMYIHVHLIISIMYNYGVVHVYIHIAKLILLSLSLSLPTSPSIPQALSFLPLPPYPKLSPSSPPPSLYTLHLPPSLTGHGGGWGYSNSSIEAIWFSTNTDIILGGFGLYGGRGHYSAEQFVRESR